MSKNFIHLHVHSKYSLINSSINVKNLVKKAKELKMPAVSITDKNTLYGVYKFYKEACKANIKPIIGAEIVYKNFSYILLAKNYEGYKNLIKIVSFVNFSKKFEFKDYSDNLIMLLNGIEGELENILHSNLNKAETILEKYLRIFNQDFYIEIINGGLLKHKLTNNILINLAEKYSIPVVATNNCKFLEKSETTGEFYFKTAKEMYALFSDVDKAISNSIEISRKCNLEFEFYQYSYPLVFIRKNKSDYEYLSELTKESLTKKINENLIDKDKKNIYLKRLNYELEIIKKQHLCRFFLFWHGILSFCRQNNILAFSYRGNSTASLVNYLLNITNIDPIKHNLFFETFICPERNDIPEIIVDVDKTYKADIIEYIKSKYGVLKTGYPLYFYNNKNDFIVYDDVICVSDKYLTEKVPVIKLSENIIGIQANKETITDIGIIGFKIHGSNILTKISKIVEQIKQKNKLNISQLPLDDAKTFELILSGKTKDIPILAGKNMKKVIDLIQPQKLDDIALVLSIYRYLKFKKNILKIKKYPNALSSYKKILQETSVYLIYQEQLAEIAYATSYLNYGEIFYQINFIKKFSRKNIQFAKNIIKRYKNTFVKQRKSKISIKNAHHIFNKILDYAPFLNPKSQVIGVAHIIYLIAFLKSNYPEEFKNIFLQK